MKKFVVLFLILALTPFFSQAQKTVKKGNAPDEKITVKREYDKNGNLTRFDSLRVFSWSSDSTFRFPPDGGWQDFFGKEFFDNQFGKNFKGDSAFSFRFPKQPVPFHFFNEEDFFKGFGDVKNDSVFSRNFFFHNDTSFFMGPHSSMMLPPGFIAPDLKGMQDLEKLFREHFKSFSPDEIFNNPFSDEPAGKFMNPQQQDEWDKMMQRQQKEQEEFIKKWNKQQTNKKIEKM
jgi:hypothetical protein